jgi:hypothetical protein
MRHRLPRAGELMAIEEAGAGSGGQCVIERERVLAPPNELHAGEPIAKEVGAF